MLQEYREEYQQLLLENTAKASPANFNGVNSHMLLDINPERIVVPILHTPMGLVDKVLESFKSWVNLEVEALSQEEDYIRQQFKAASTLSHAADHDYREAIALNEQLKTQDTLGQVKVLKQAWTTAKKEEKIAKNNYEEMIAKHNAKIASVTQRFEDVYRSLGIKREHYHGGKFNGVNSIRIMSKAEELFVGSDTSIGFLQRLLQEKAPHITDECVAKRCQEYADLMGVLDAIWSSVRGIDSGLLPSEEQLAQLEKAINKAKQLWITCGLTTRQPKWHLAFDGHLLHQMRNFGGLADKADDSIEFQHQTLKRLNDRYRALPSYKVRTRCILRELRRHRSKKIMSQIEKYNKLKSHKDTSKRKADAVGRNSAKKEAKRVKRQVYIDK